MPLPTPTLDDRSWEEIRQELLRRIPAYTPEWTDHNPSDPGIALLELFAFLGENLLFRFNQIPEATQLQFLRLLDVPLRPATSARSLLALSTTRPGGLLVEGGAEALAGDVPFETRTEARVLPLEARGVARSMARAPDRPEEEDFAQAVVEARGGLSPGEHLAFYENALVPGTPAGPSARPVDLRRSVDGYLWIAVLRTEHTDPAELAGRVLNVGFIPEPMVPSLDDAQPAPGGDRSDPGPAVVWQGTGGPAPDGTPRFRALRVVGDTTHGLTREGVVRLELPPDPTDLAPIPQDDPELSGTGDFPPTLEDEEEEERILFWIRAGRVREEYPFGEVRWVGVNAVEAVQARTARPEFLGTGDGQPRQEFGLIHAPILTGSLILEVEEGDRWIRWRGVDHLRASGPEDRHYVLDREAGRVRFGSGIQGRAPGTGERIRATEYRYGGGRAGNVPADAVDRLPDFPELDVQNPMPARGGADDEPLEEALERIPGELRRRDRAVTAGDFRELALETPGADVGRAETLPLFHPPTREEGAAGVVSVVVWPREDPQSPNAPRPTRGMIRDVCRWLDRRRLITTELWVIPPTYRKIVASVGVRVSPDHGVEAIRRWVELVLRQYLAPLPPYGPEGSGWPLGRSVRDAELEAAVLQVEGVAFLEGDLRLARWVEGQGLEDEGRWEEESTVALSPWEVPELWEVSVVEGEPLPPGEAMRPVPPRGPEGEPGTEGPGAGEPGGIPGHGEPSRPVPVPLPHFQAEC